MFAKLIKHFSGRQYRKYVARCQPIVARINELEKSYQSLSDDQLRAKTLEFRARFAEAFAKGRPRFASLPQEERSLRERDLTKSILDDLLPEAFAACKSAARRLCGTKALVNEHELSWDMVYFDVQFIGGMALHDRKIAEMATGEGKTFVATLPLYLNALSGRNCQLITVNDYLARRDSEWMGHLYRFLGLSVGCIQSQMPQHIRHEMYACDITYGTASEFGFDYLRDNGMATTKEEQVQRDHYFCIIDEADSILIDEARVPLIISGPDPASRDLPFPVIKGGVERLVRQQLNFVNKVAGEAETEVKMGKWAEKDSNTLNKLLQVKLGAPKNKLLLRSLQDGKVRNAFEKHEMEMQADYNKQLFYELKEQLFFAIDERGHTADLTEKGRTFLKPDDPDAFVLPDLPTIYTEIDANPTLDLPGREQAKAAIQDKFDAISQEIHCISQLLRAYSLYERDVQYVVEGGKVVIVDENTGRKMSGRRWSEGLHAAVEAKEGVQIEPETKTYATITLQNYFRMYEKLAGMTGTAETETQEFRDIYKLDVMVVPTNRPIARKDDEDVIYKTKRDKFTAVVEEVKKVNATGQPILIGTESVESSEVLSRFFRGSKIEHEVLNAKHHEREAEIVALAGRKGAVTIATNMAGRGTDIKLGEGVKDLGGLYVIGTERHTSRRIDRQLRGRSGRQGDPGYTKFYIALEDDLLRLFANNGAIGSLLQRSIGEGAVPLPTWVIENAQKRVEEQRYAMRKQLLQYDDVLNRQRQVIYSLRNDAIHTEDTRSLVFELVAEEINARVASIGFDDPKNEPDANLVEEFIRWVHLTFPVSFDGQDVHGRKGEEIRKHLLAKVEEAYRSKETVEQPEDLRGLERYTVITAIDKLWQTHLTEMDNLRQEVGLAGYGQKDPLQEYKKQAYDYFEQLVQNVRVEVCKGLFRSATSLMSFEKMLGVLSQSARAIGPSEDGSAAQAAPAATISAPAAAVVAQTIASHHRPAGPAPVLPELSRNAMVTIRKDGQLERHKWKKAQGMILNEGWEFIMSEDEVRNQS